MEICHRTLERTEFGCLKIPGTEYWVVVDIIEIMRTITFGPEVSDYLSEYGLPER